MAQDQMIMDLRQRAQVTRAFTFLEILASTYEPELYDHWSWTIRTLWSWTIHNLKEFSKSNISRTIFEMYTAPGACLLYAPGAGCFSNMLLERYAFQIWSWSIFDLENSFRLLMIQNHKVLMFQDHMVQDHIILDHKSRPKSPKRHSDNSSTNCKGRYHHDL